MLNKAMEEKINSGDCIDVSQYPRSKDGYWILPSFDTEDDKDYCYARNEAWIWSIGRRYDTGEIHASLSSELYQHPEYECLFLR